MNYAIDTSSLINLHNAHVLELVLRLARGRVLVGPIVLREAGEGIAAILRSSPSVSVFDDSDISSTRYLDLLGKHRLGDGETEVLAIAEQQGVMVCSDDSRARTIGERLFGSERVIGSLRLMRWCVEDALCECVEAFTAAAAMRDLGGFLPDTPREFFCAAVEGC